LARGNAGAVAALAAWPVAVAVAATAAIALLTVIVAVALVAEWLLRRDTVKGLLGRVRGIHAT
jgi:hypothetical protein